MNIGRPFVAAVRAGRHHGEIMAAIIIERR